MTPTSDERREVAEELRKTRGIFAFVEALGIDPDGDWCWTDVSRRVADLIDPTCEVEQMPDCVPHHRFSRWMCGKCGIVSFTPSNATGPSYCPYCGHRLVSDNGK